MPRFYTDHEVDAAVLEDQHRRLQERLSDPTCQLVQAGDGLPGLVWRPVAIAPQRKRAASA
jgi:hypothetical protein